MKRAVSVFVITLVFWVLLTWQEILEEGIPPFAVGVLTAFIVTAASWKFFPAVSIHPIKVIYFLVYIGAFLWEVIKSNFDVAYRVLHPKMPINPGIVRVPVTLTSEYGKTILANSITLTPGTLTLDIKDQNFYIHWLTIKTYDPEEAATIITGRFMRFLGKVFS